PACASIRRATSPATRPRARRWGTWREASNAIRNWNPFWPTASGSSASRSNQAAGSATNWPSATASTSAEAGTSEFDLSFFPLALRHSTTTRKTLLRARNGFSCLDQQQSETASRRQRGHARTRPYHPFEDRPREDRAVPVHHLPQDRRGYLPGPASKSASTGPAGMNRTSTAGSQIPSRGVRSASQM